MHDLLGVPVAPGVERPRSLPRLALIDTDAATLHVLGDRFRRRGWEFETFATTDPARICEMRLSAVVVDIAVLGADGWLFVEQLGREAPEVALVVCTAQSSVAQRVRGLHLGADDWLTKPVHPDEVVARIEAILRRRDQATARIMSRAQLAGELEIRADQFQAFAGDRSADLTRREFELLRLLAGASGKVLEREEIYQRVWGYRMARGERSVDVFVRKVRQKLERVSPGWKYIHTHMGVGYRFEPEPLDV